MQFTVPIPAGSALTLTTDEVSSGLYVQVQPGTLYTPNTIAADTSVIIGPFNDSRNYLVDYSGNEPVYSVAPSGVYTGADDALTVKTTDDITALTALNEANVAEIVDAATGAQIATAVNGILAILVAAGLMAAPE